MGHDVHIFVFSIVVGAVGVVGAVVVCLGVNGAGKTTALRILCGDELASSGQAVLAGMRMATHPDEVRRLIGYCPQFDALHELLTVRVSFFFFSI